jgi:hypothetical protein
MSSKGNHHLEESVLADLIVEADDQIFMRGNKLDYRAHVAHTAHHISTNYRLKLQKFLRKVRAAEKKKTQPGEPVRAHQKPQNRNQGALIPVASTSTPRNKLKKKTPAKKKP